MLGPPARPDEIDPRFARHPQLDLA